MSSTNKTTNYSLPQWIGTDHPSFSEDFNPAFSIIDGEIKTVNDKAETANTTATSASNKVDSIIGEKTRMTCSDFDNLFITNINKEE